jgi:hypothetical protein
MRWCPALVAMMVSAAAPAMADVSIAIGGDAAAHYSLECAGPDAKEPFRAEGHPPARYELEVTDLDCTLRQTAAGARIEVTVTSDSGNRSHLSTSGAGSLLRFMVR